MLRREDKKNPSNSLPSSSSKPILRWDVWGVSRFWLNHSQRRCLTRGNNHFLHLFKKSSSYRVSNFSDNLCTFMSHVAWQQVCMCLKQRLAQWIFKIQATLLWALQVCWCPHNGHSRRIRKTKNRPRLFQDIMMPNLWEESSVFSTIAHLIVTINNLLVKSIIHLRISSFLFDGVSNRG